MHCLKTYNGKYIMYYIKHYILSDKILELHRVENYNTEYITFIPVKLKLYNLENYNVYKTI